MAATPARSRRSTRRNTSTRPARSSPRLREAFPDQRFEVERELHADGAVVLCLRWHGTHLGTFASPLGEIAPTGRRFSTRGIEIFDVRDDRVVGVRTAWNFASVVAQLRD
jgi:predicted ester cyclase